MQDSFEKLQNLLGPDGWTRDPDRLRPHLEEWRGQYHGENSPYDYAGFSGGDCSGCAFVC